jgi:hypothetical protein
MEILVLGVSTFYLLVRCGMDKNKIKKVVLGKSFLNMRGLLSEETSSALEKKSTRTKKILK